MGTVVLLLAGCTPLERKCAFAHWEILTWIWPEYVGKSLILGPLVLIIGLLNCRHSASKQATSAQ